MATNNLITNANFTREEQHFFINSTEIPGVQSIEATSEINSVPLVYIGMTGISYIPVGPQQGQVSINALLISNDQFIDFTGKHGVNGYILKKQTNTGDNFGFTSGYLTSYSSTCSIGQIPQIGAQFLVVGNIGKIDSSEASSVITNFTSITGATSTLALKIADPGSMTISLSDFDTNRVQSYSLNINVPRQVNYILGDRYPNSVEINYPMQVSLDFTVDYNDYVTKSIRDFPFNDKIRNITLVHKNLEDSSTISTFAFTGMQLTSERYATDVNGSVTLTAKYQTFLN